MDGSLRVPLSKPQGLHRPVLCISLAALDADVFGLHVVIVVKDEPAIIVPEWDTLVHTVVPSLKTLNGPLRCSAKHARKILLDTLPFKFPVVPGVDDEISLFCGVLLVDVPPLAVWRWAGVAVHPRRAEIAANGIVWVTGLMD